MSTVSNKPAKLSRWHPLKKRTAQISRWLHIYLSMAAFGLILFFSVTGLTLNHPEWFNQITPQTRTITGSMPAALLKQPDSLRVVEYLRNHEHIHASVGTVNVDDDQISLSFDGPGYEADTSIQRANGSYQIVETRSGFWAILNDLHKGHETGKVWGKIIDASAILLAVVSLTGLVMIFFLYKRRTAGLVLAAAGTLVCLLVYKLLIS